MDGCAWGFFAMAGGQVLLCGVGLFFWAAVVPAVYGQAKACGRYFFSTRISTDLNSRGWLSAWSDM